eukprot:TRINITY_DN6848_c0_g2_i1.p1 TRINITY_DN6848_c0_g2~~TRINITY_DN6848_c0_g2_i1.p1  ORF type:complete len:494 (+),score=93.47 TRINITY_DN6848_c0_g2_i1:115-1482(+)
MTEYETRYQSRNEYVPRKKDWLDSFWQGFKSWSQISKIRKTGIDKKTYDSVGAALTTLPEGFTPHKKLAGLLKKRQQMIEGGKGIDWAVAEALAFGSLMKEGNLIRLSGQDVERGTFSHRHAVLHDMNTDETYTPLSTVNKSAAQPIFQVHNSSLSEYGVLGFETGFSLESPNALVIWEAQFGDFANGAQVIFDQFLSSGEKKWLRMCGLVVLLPHGYDGQGPEHSSSRIERMLQLSDCDPQVYPDNMDPESRTQIQQTNIQVVNCSTPANYFHVLRRQIHREFRKPLIIAAPKRLLRHPAAVSNIDEFLDDKQFTRVMRDPSKDLVEPSKIKRILFCTGNVFYDLYAEREARGANDTAIIRVEQLAPAPFDRLREVGQMYPNAEIVWAQEEPKNMGCWTWMYHVLKTSCADTRGVFEPRYIGRIVAASPATGSPKKHQRQLKEILEQAFDHYSK